VECINCSQENLAQKAEGGLIVYHGAATR